LHKHQWEVQLLIATANQPTHSSSAPWHTLDTDGVADSLGIVPEQGLADTETQRRLSEYGPNELVERGLKSPWRILWEQLTAVMMLVLVVAAAIKALSGDYLDAVAILAIVALNAVLGFVQEYRAERAMAALKQLAAPLVRVRRAGRVQEIAARELVPGDIILLEAGSAVPADARVIESVNLRLQEAALTGESQPVEKSAHALHDADMPIGDQRNMLFLGTAVTYGRGTAMVVATGMRTQLGRIAELIQAVESGPTPLQKRIKQLGVVLGLGVLGIIAISLVLAAVRGQDLWATFLDGVVIAVAAIPEGLPAVMTITLALGAQRMLKRRALIRKLPAVETLGSVTVICSDKTGTLTQNKMTVTILDIADQIVDLQAWTVKGQPILHGDDMPEKLRDADHRLLLTASVLCNDALIQPDQTRPGAGAFTTIGDPTEAALLVAGGHFGLWKDDLEHMLPRVAEAPFTSERKRMTTVHRRPTTDPSMLLRAGDRPLPNGRAPDVSMVDAWWSVVETSYVAFTKGSVDGLLDISDRVWVNGRDQPLDPAWRTRIEASNSQLAAQGLRVLGVAVRSLDQIPPVARLEAELERGLIFVGLIGMIDPPRPEVKEAIAVATTAGIRTVMITGDHPLTAQQIARELGIVPPGGGRVLTGQELARLSEAELEQIVEHVSVYARVAPEQKLNLVHALQRRGHVVAMTGDGVNDAPALRKADIGVAMGITGTDVSKEAANMVILDDNFATIKNAVEEGRTIYDNVRKFVKYIVTSNSAEVTVMFTAQLLGMGLPLSTLQILWMNLVTDGVPGLALGLEPTERDTMRRKPFAPNESIFSRGIGWHIGIFGLLLAAVAFGVGYWAWANQLRDATGSALAWGTMVFMTLTLAQLGHALAVRSNRESLFRIGLRTNPLLLGAVLITLLLQLLVIYLPPLQILFGTVPLTINQLLICLGASTIVFWGVEIEKWLLRRRA
jgi:P-type Ca2+ transporter type 2C